MGKGLGGKRRDTLLINKRWRKMFSILVSSDFCLNKNDVDYVYPFKKHSCFTTFTKLNTSFCC